MALLSLAFGLVSVLSFEAGLLTKSLKEPEPMVVRVPEVTNEKSAPVKNIESMGEAKIVSPLSPASSDCSYVGSKNSNKYHTPFSRCAKQIKPENLVCFASIDAAKARGYIEGCME